MEQNRSIKEQNFSKKEQNDGILGADQQNQLKNLKKPLILKIFIGSQQAQ